MICPFAQQHPGSLMKTNAGPRLGRGAVLHSAEGSLQGTLNQLDGPAMVLWHFTVGLDGTLYQHYDTMVQCWHAHAVGNVSYIGVEHENAYTDGHPNHDPFTDEQVATDVKLLRWLDEGPYARGVTLWEHRLVPGNQTTCPNGRIPWEKLMAELNPDPTPTPPQPSELEALRALNRTAAIIIAGDQNLADSKPEDKAAMAWVNEKMQGG